MKVYLIIFVVTIFCIVDLFFYVGKNIKEKNIIVSSESKEEHQFSEATEKFEQKVKKIIVLSILLVLIQALLIVIQL